jgi:predicted component of type VI protein secretion system
VLESFVTKTRDKVAALKFIKKAMKRHSRTRAIVTDGRKSHGAALKKIGADDLQQTGRWLNNHVENSYLPFRRRERAMNRFRRMKTLQKFSSVHAQVHNHFSQERHLVSREIYKERRSAALAEWQSVMAERPAGLGPIAPDWRRVAVQLTAPRRNIATAIEATDWKAEAASRPCFPRCHWRSGLPHRIAPELPAHRSRCSAAR